MFDLPRRQAALHSQVVRDFAKREQYWHLFCETYELIPDWLFQANIHPKDIWKFFGQEINWKTSVLFNWAKVINKSIKHIIESKISESC